MNTDDFQTSESTAKLDAALAEVQGVIEAASKDSMNPHFGKKYADLTAVWDACRPALVKHKISVTQWPVHSEDGRLHLITRLALAGEWMRCRFSIPVQRQDAQGYGSGVTYAKRYALAAALGVVSEEDDDGETAVGRKNDAPVVQQSSPAKAEPAPNRNDVRNVRCPKCNGPVWDNRTTKKNPKAPDFKCQDKTCDGAVWPPKDAQKKQPVTVGAERDEPTYENFDATFPDEEGLPF